MTTHFEKIQALGNKMVSNLQSMGVSASFNDGGLTLADKILDIQHFDNGILVYSDMAIAQSGDSVNLYALVLDGGVGVANQTVTFKVDGVSIGTATTGSDGVAVKVYSAVGAGLISVTAESSSVVSKTYGILDCIKVDKGTITEHSDIWSIPSNLDFTRTSEYTEFKEKTIGSNFGTTVTGLTDSCVIEMDYYQVDGELTNTFMQLHTSSGTSPYTGGIALSNLGGSLENWYHLKITIKDGKATILNTDTSISIVKQLTGSPSQFVFWSSGDITTVRCKNFCIYPI